MRDVLAAVLPPDPRAVVVDLGCGPGANIAALADRYAVVGIDNAKEAIEHARERFAGVEFIRGIAPRDLGEIARSVSAYLVMDVLEHVRDPEALLASIVETLRPGGLVLITVPASMHLWSEQDVRLGHFRRYEPVDLRRSWAGLPVTELMLSHFNSRLYPAIRFVRGASRLFGRAWGREGSDMRVSKGPVNHLLTRIFSGESRRLVELARGERRRAYSRGVSLLALLRRDPDAPFGADPSRLMP